VAPILSDSLLTPEEEYEYLVDHGELPETDVMLPSGYLSVTQVGTFIRCPKQYEFRYVKGIISPPQARIAEGSAMHKALEAGHRERMVSGTTAPLGVLMDAHNDAWKDEKQRVEVWDEESPESLILKRARVFLSEYHKHFLPHIEPIGVERRFWATVEDNIPVLGYIDLIAVDSNPRLRHRDEPEKEVVDYKVIAKTYSKNEVDGNLQLTTYSHATGIPRVRFDMFVKTKTPAVKSLSSIRTSQDWKWAQRIFSDIGHAISKGVFPPTMPTEWCCTKKWCGYFPLCRGSL